MGKCLLCNAYQKFFSALDSLKNLQVNNDFFTNISAIDKFLQEFRNITFVLQKELKNSGQEELYNKANQKFLMNNTNMKWFITARNQVCKEEPFNLAKWVLIVIYKNGFEIPLCVERFDMDTDIPISDIKASLPIIFKDFDVPEIFGTCYFSFAEQDTKVKDNNDLYNKLLYGIETMTYFMNYLNSELNISCKICDSFRDKIKNLYSSFLSLDITFARDFEYLKNINKFSFAAQGEFLFIEKNKIQRQKNIVLNDLYVKDNDYNLDNHLYNFILIHLPLYQMHKTIMPTFMIVYKDNYYKFITFQLDCKATMYRLQNQIAQDVLKENIKSIGYMGEIYSYVKSDKLLNTTYLDRQKLNPIESLIFSTIDFNLNKSNIAFESSKIDDMNYVKQQLENHDENMFFNWGPIEMAFIAKQKSE